MMNLKLIRLALVSSLSLSLVGCGGPAHQGALAASELRAKMMRYQQVHLHQRLFFVGIAQGTNLQIATSGAYKEIIRQLTWLPPGSRHLLGGLYRVDRSATDSEGSIHVLAVLEREAAASHMRRLRDEKLQNLRNDLLRCRQRLESGEIAATRTCLPLAKKKLRSARDMHIAAIAAVGDQALATPLPEESELRELSKRLDSTLTRNRSVLVHVLRIVDRRQKGDLNAYIQTLVSASGMKLVSGGISPRQVMEAMSGSTASVAAAGKKTGAGYLIVGNVKSRFIGSEMGQYFAMASGRLKIIETLGGRTVVELSTGDVKGGHISRRYALNKAADAAIKELSIRLKDKLKHLP